MLHVHPNLVGTAGFRPRLDQAAIRHVFKQAPCGHCLPAALLHHIATGTPSPVSVRVRGGETLEVGFSPSSSGLPQDVTLKGPADFVFDGQIMI